MSFLSFLFVVAAHADSSALANLHRAKVCEVSGSGTSITCLDENGVIVVKGKLRGITSGFNKGRLDALWLMKQNGFHAVPLSRQSEYDWSDFYERDN